MPPNVTLSLTTEQTASGTACYNYVLICYRFMPCLKYIVQHAENTEYKLLRGKTIECISLIGLAVGREKVTDISITIYVVLCITA